MQYTKKQIAAIKAARDAGKNAKSPSGHHTAMTAFLDLASDESFCDDDRDAFARMAADHYDRA